MQAKWLSWELFFWFALLYPSPMSISASLLIFLSFLLKKRISEHFTMYCLTCFHFTPLDLFCHVLVPWIYLHVSLFHLVFVPLWFCPINSQNNWRTHSIMRRENYNTYYLLQNTAKIDKQKTITFFLICLIRLCGCQVLCTRLVETSNEHCTHTAIPCQWNWTMRLARSQLAPFCGEWAQSPCLQEELSCLMLCASNPPTEWLGITWEWSTETMGGYLMLQTASRLHRC